MSTEPTPRSEPPSNSEYRAVKCLLVAIGLCVLIVTASFNYFLFREILHVRKQIDSVSGSVSSVSGFNSHHVSNAVPVMRSFLAELQTFARSNPDFRPILGKYIPLTNAVAAPTAPASPAAPARSAAPPPDRGAR